MRNNTVLAEKKIFTTQFELTNHLLNNLDKLGEFNLSLASRTVLIFLTSKYPNIFPSREHIAKKTLLSLSSVKRAIKELADKGLIIYETKQSNNYKFTNLFFDSLDLIPQQYKKDDISRSANLTHRQVQFEPSGGFTVNPKQITLKNKKHTSCEFFEKNISEQKNDDVSLKNSFSSEQKLKTSHKSKKPSFEKTTQKYTSLLQKLNYWNFKGADFVLKKHGVDKIAELVSFVEEKKPDNYGAYFRSLLNLPVMPCNNIKTIVSTPSIPKYTLPDPIKCGTPLDFNREQALDFVRNLHPMLKNKGWAVQLQDKWNFSPDEFAIKESLKGENSFKQLEVLLNE